MSLQTAASRVSDLRSRDAAEEAWQWIVDLKEAAKSDRSGAETQLNSIFKLGTPPTDLDGPTNGILVMTTTNSVLDAAVRFVTSLWMPWRGKRFDSKGHTGDNRMISGARLPSKLLWPLYKMKDSTDGKLAFDFKTYNDAGKADPGTQVMVIDYSEVEANPRLIIRSIRDELVEVVPGTYLGKILFRLPRDRYEMIGFFALRT
ncbi:hypothetical protein F0Q45_03170 [Mycobacterium simiae]|uniref:Uncharacterized protein n=1 Tax=Mycobacterium simiae TaxID=1784 RepID=A0A5B1BUI1_MYCSI|nr:hypothetical protein [Mycobacterium simiae]KAA1251631.1 hypothetical protein F0Q45_03170 [Mycobacterium simiae]